MESLRINKAVRVVPAAPGEQTSDNVLNKKSVASSGETAWWIWSIQLDGDWTERRICFLKYIRQITEYHAAATIFPENVLEDLADKDVSPWRDAGEGCAVFVHTLWIGSLCSWCVLHTPRLWSVMSGLCVPCSGGNPSVLRDTWFIAARNSAAMQTWNEIHKLDFSSCLWLFIYDLQSSWPCHRFQLINV